MADNDSQPPGWPFNEEPPPIPPVPAPEAYEPPLLPTPPVASPPPPAAYPPPAAAPTPPAPAYPPPAPGYPPPVAPAAAPYQQAAAPGYPPPGQPPPPPAGWAQPAKKNNKNVLITVAVIIGVVILGIGSCTVWFVNTVKAPVDEANRFLALVDSGDYQEAAALVPIGCDGSDVDPQVLQELFGGQPITYDLKSSSITNNNATVSGAFSSSFRPNTEIEVFLRDRDGWVVCGFRFNG